MYRFFHPTIGAGRVAISEKLMGAKQEYLSCVLPSVEDYIDVTFLH
jgi:hypothetical protein